MKPPLHPPRWASRLLQTFCAPHLLEEVQGDLQERFGRRVALFGERVARRQYAAEVLSFLRPFALKRQPEKFPQPFFLRPAMFRNNLKIALRTLWKAKGLATINLVGLSTGMACSLLIFLFARHELSYDRYHVDADRIYRVVKDFVNDDGTRLPDATTPPALAPALQREIPEVAHVTRVYPNWGQSFLIRRGEKRILEERLYRVDSSFFDVFSVPFVQGNARTVFQQVNSIALTETAARRYFGEENPMGKVLGVDNLGDLMVTGVLRDVPANSHFHFDFLISVRKFGGNPDADWGWYNFYTYAKLKPNTQVATVEPKIQALYKRNQAAGTNVFYTQAVPDIHLSSNLKWELEPNSDRLYVRVFASVGLFILLLAAINYINLATARSSARAKEIGVRKVAGAFKSSLVRQFLIESVLLSLLAAVVALALAQLFLPLVNNLTQKQLALFEAGNPFVLVGAMLTALVVGLLAGLFPALYLSSFKPIAVLKGLKIAQKGVFNLRKALVVVQFTISIALVAGALVISQQMRFIQNAKLGLNKEQVLVIRDAGFMSRATRTVLKDALRQVPGVAKVTTADGIVGGQNWTNGMRAKGSDNEQLVNFLTVGNDFFEAMGMEIGEGRGFSEQFSADTMGNGTGKILDQTIGSVVLNERAVKDLSVPAPAIGQQVVWGQDGDTTYYLKVVGVVKDFHFTSFRSDIKPFAFVKNPNREWNLTVKLSTANLTATLSRLQTEWNALVPDRPFQYSFLDDTFDKLYQSEQRFQGVFIVLVALGILIACLGLFALSAFAAEQRTKEIGVRKVLGASVAGIVTLLSKDFLKLVLIAIVIAS
ncbi:MAG: ABC transporter permease, partial [Sphingobacteriaceae bacterium]|nr:ABC transporter permease [Cytophagaceae bacterium]